MALNRLRISALRCIEHADFALHPERNYFFGPNGAGKTTILEAVYLLGRGRSFRTRQVRRLVRRGADGFAVFGEIGTGGRSHRVGVGFHAGSLEKKVDGDVEPRTSVLAAILPVHVIEPGVHALVEGGPSERRRFLDWGVFHVEPSYLDAWRLYRRVLGQRNAVLRTGSVTEVRTWTTALVDAAKPIDQQRADYVNRLSEAASKIGRSLLGRSVAVDYRRGWSSTLELAEVLQRSEAGDRAGGHTSAGPHRADLAVTVDESQVRDDASRGQQKMIATTLVLAQLSVYSVLHDAGGVLLLDDPAAELDTAALDALMTFLETIPVQLLQTSLARAAARDRFPVFHVERGIIRAL